MLGELRHPYVDDHGYVELVAKIPIEVRGNHGHAPALYAIQFLDDKTIKIGRSSTLRERMRTYVRARGSVRILFILPRQGGEEQRVLDLCRPWAIHGRGGKRRRGRITEYHRPFPGLIQALDRVYRELLSEASEDDSGEPADAPAPSLAVSSTTPGA